MPNAAALQVPLNNLLQSNVKGKTFLNCIDLAIEAFAKCKESIASGVFLAYPDPEKPLAIFTDTSDFAVGAVL